MRSDFEVEGRRREILSAVVRKYILTGSPVASRAIADMLPQSLSPATVRHVMAELESEGYLEQPHKSAGRVPTDRAYRQYVDHLMTRREVSVRTRRFIADMLPKAGSPPEALMDAASRVLSRVSGSVGVVLGPSTDERILKEMRFVRLDERRVLAVAILHPESLEDRVLKLHHDVSQADLDRAANYLASEFRGWSLRTIRLELLNRVEQARLAVGRTLRDLGSLLDSGALGEDDPGPLFVDGAAKTLCRPDFDDVHKIREFLGAIEERTTLVNLLSAFIRRSDRGVRISIGKENPEMRHCALIVAPLPCGTHALGALGVVGPTRMEYDRAVPAVGYLAGVFGRLLSAN